MLLESRYHGVLTLNLTQKMDVLMQHDEIKLEQDAEQEKDFEKMLEINEHKVTAHKKNLNILKVENIAQYYNSWCCT
jgi:hypothetical protein